ncbi:MAG: sulfite exporter TauE/SafE family protein [Clostridiales bacterium]|nr:sulfite exporter TauE/SafE family protein [Clostridiales bacterium]
MTIFLYILLGFAAELIDGTAGMAYGVSSNTFLRLTGMPSAVSSACVHSAEIFTTLVSGLSHLRLKNINWKLFWMLLLPGALGGIGGAYMLSNFESTILDVIIDLYLIVMGIVILVKAFQRQKLRKDYGRYACFLGLVGGFSDAMGGGGWGPVVTSTLLATGHEPRKTIGTVNSAEFFVTLAETTTFVAILGNFRSYFTIILGLIIGGVIAAPIGAVLCKKLPVRWILTGVGILVILLNVIKLLQHIGLI